MKQVFITNKVAYASGAKGTDYTTVPEGAIACISLDDYSVLTGKPKCDFAIVVGNKEGVIPTVFPEVNINSLNVTKAEYEEGKAFTAKFTIPTPVVDKSYSLVIAKKNVVFNERNTWTFDAIAKSTTPADVAKELATRINYCHDMLGIKATASAAVITITADNIGEDFEVLGADTLFGVKPTSITHGKKAILDKEYVANMLSIGAAGKGFNHTAVESHHIYPGYPEPIAEDKYVMYTLRFAVPRAAAKTRDEVVSQEVNILCPVGAGSIGTLDTIFGVGATSTSSGS